MFLEANSSVAQRYAPPQLPRDSRALMRFVSQRFCSGISLTGREASTIASLSSCFSLKFAKIQNLGFEFGAPVNRHRQVEPGRPKSQSHELVFMDFNGGALKE